MLIKGQGINIIEKIRNKNNKVETREREKEMIYAKRDLI
jgi:hypothetical protein